MALNTGQELAATAIVAAFEAKKVLGHTLIGEGGTGKTYTCIEVIRRIIKLGNSVLVTAPTNKAVKQLYRAARAAGLDTTRVAFKTIHSAMGLSLLPDKENKAARSVRESVLCDYDFLVLDEASMLSEFMLFNYLIPELQANGLFCLLMGDDMQLPPVREEKSMAFGIFPCSELTKPERNQNNPDGSPNGILQLTHPLREAIKERREFRFTVVPDKNVVALKDSQFLQHVLSLFDKDTDMEHTRVLAWRNRRVDDLNNAIRRKIYGKDAARFEVGERIVTGGTIKDLYGDVLLNTDEECIVSAHKEGKKIDKQTNESYKTILLTLQPIYSDVQQAFAHVLDEIERPRYERRLEELAQKAQAAEGKAQGYWWRQYHEFKGMFNEIRYCYCLTVHRSQGSTYKRAIVDIKDILGNPVRSERQRLAYVAFSRGAEELITNKTAFAA
jgi:ATP-dependent exoDNAse (exonuclease V) alpha subunit